MKSYFEGLNQDDAEMIETLSRITYMLRENRKLLLEQNGVENEQALLDRILSGEIAEHPSYENYLSARILSTTREVIRDELSMVMQKAKTA